KKDDTKTPDKPKDEVVSGDDITNLLPNESKAVLYFNNSGKEGVPAVLPDSNVADALFRNGAFDQDAFKNKFGFALNEIDTLVVAITPEQLNVQGKPDVKGWSFGVIRTKTVVNEKTLSGLNLTSKGKIEGFEYFEIKADLDPFSVALFKNFKVKPTTLHFYDP